MSSSKKTRVADNQGANQPLLKQQDVSDDFAEIEEENSLMKNDKYGYEQQLTDSNGKQEKENDQDDSQRDRTDSDSSNKEDIPNQAPRRTFEVNTIFREDQQDRKFMSNKVVTTKYNCATFLPKNMFVQFSKMANAYFLFMTGLQMVPGLQDFYGAATTLMPLCFVVGVSMIKDAFEDNKRRKQDNEENRAICQVAPRGSRAFIDTKSLDIEVGCLVKIKEHEFFPCDMLMVSTSLPKGIAYVETKNLDGETNLKHKQVEKTVLRLASSEQLALSNFNGAVINCEGPNEYLYKFEGNLTLPDGAVIPIDPDQILLRGSCLRNTEWVMGICVYSGHETKIMKNGAKSKAKVSKIAKATNNYIVVTMLFQLSLSIIAAVATSIWTFFRGSAYWYIYPGDTNDDQSLVSQIAQQTGIWFIALMNFVPISLLVTLEMINFIQAYFISVDIALTDEPRGLQASVQSSNLNEELGMVHYIFSDKTGTLTQNVMEFKRFSVGLHEYGQPVTLAPGQKAPEPKVYPDGVTNVNFEDPKFYKHIENKNHENNKNLKHFHECLGLCHTVIADVKTNKQNQKYIAYNASSPDELALVNGARHLGFYFRERDADNNMVCETWDGEKQYKLLNLIEFDSTRKRMTVVVRNQENQILVICKGADSIIEKRLKAGQSTLKTTQGFMEAYAKEGLRTLLIASKYIGEQEYEAWSKKFQVASTSINKEKEINKVAEELEVEFDLVGSTAIEDKLQDEVGKTIYDIKRAGVQLWVLTGDKVETAINIGHSCQLLHDAMNMFVLQEITPKKVRVELTTCAGNQKMTKQARDNAVVVAGETLATIQEDDDLIKEFIDLCEGANVVLACRVSPKQKAEIVHMMRARNPEKTTLAIGDGANDVNMIMAAHVGVGISGLEGQQAARSADYSIGQFRFLRFLLFFHGREAYRRNSFAIGYMFYKNILETVPIYMYGFLSLFSGFVIYNSLLYISFNTFYTALPIIWFATQDSEYTKQLLAYRPRFYKIGLSNAHFTGWVFTRWVFYAFWQASLIMFLAFYSLEAFSPNYHGKNGGIFVAGNFVFGALVIVANMKVLISSFQISGWQLFLIIGSTLFYILCYCVISGGIAASNDYGTFYMLMSAPQTYFALILLSFMFVLVDTGLQYLNQYINKWYQAQKEKAEREQKKKSRQSKTVIKRKISTYKNRGFAFSQEKGNDPMITENLSTRIGHALLQRIQNTQGITFEPLIETADEDLLTGDFNHCLQDLSSQGSLDAPISALTQSQNSKSEVNFSTKEKDLYMLAATHLKEGHISKIDERPDSEDAMSSVYQNQSVRSSQYNHMQLRNSQSLPGSSSMPSENNLSPQNQLSESERPARGSQKLL